VESRLAILSTGNFLRQYLSCLLYIRGGALVKIKYFIIISSCILYLIAAGLFSRAVWDFESYQWGKVIGGDLAELGSGPGTYDIRKSVW
jgi:high-affinity iron transporter